LASHQAGVRLQSGVSGFNLRRSPPRTIFSAQRSAFSAALVIGARTFSLILDCNYRGTCGSPLRDGAGAIVLEAQEATRPILDPAVVLDDASCVRWPAPVEMFVDGGPSSTQTVGYHVGCKAARCSSSAVGMITRRNRRCQFKPPGPPRPRIDWFVFPHRPTSESSMLSAHKLHIRAAGGGLPSTCTQHAAGAPIFRASAGHCALGARRTRQEGDLALLESQNGGGFTLGFGAAPLVRPALKGPYNCCAVFIA